jgi:hypothetical protein
MLQIMDELVLLNSSRKLASICERKFVNRFYLILVNDKIFFLYDETKRVNPGTACRHKTEAL